MYEPPIKLMKCIEESIKKQNEAMVNEVYSSILKIGVNVDKEELLKALMYDRKQYDKGYKDGYKVGIKKICDRLGIIVEHSGLVVQLLEEIEERF